ncbi:MAG: septum formation initiator family protein [Bacteroidales bacterium]|nr:septum formation initiator family protein [Bacteroidales bacterium]
MKQKFLTLIKFIRTHVFTSCVIAGFAWLIFFDQHSILAIHRLNVQAKEMRKEIDDFQKMVEKYKGDIEEVSGDAEQMEHFAREQLHMKKANEDVFLIDD